MSYPNNKELYKTILPDLTRIARKCGYALAVHGSLERDLDLIAVPWIHGAREPEELIAIIKREVNGVELEQDTNPAERAYGRKVWAIYFGPGPYDFRTGPYLDISVMSKE